MTIRKKMNDGLVSLQVMKPDVKVWYINTRYIEISDWNDFNLCQYEIEQLHRLKNDRSKRDYYLSHGLLKIVLSRELQMNESEIKILFKKGHKPTTEGIYFNLSHSQGIVAIAVSKDREVGVDVQVHQFIPRRMLLEVAANVFHPSEIDRISSSKVPYELFYTYWTQKEAYGKALGKGLIYETKEMTVCSKTNRVEPVEKGCDLGWCCETHSLEQTFTLSVAYEKK